EGRAEEGTPPPLSLEKNDNGVTISGKMEAVKTNHQARQADAMGKHIIQHRPGTFTTFARRQTLAAGRNDPVRAGCRITLRQFAARHGLRHATWRADGPIPR
ncbi:MAG: hypothetical protein ACI4Q3_05620, partial [Kiritimatiellia bacterium]